jgi:hypothetical protein
MSMETGHDHDIYDFIIRGNFPNYYNTRYFVDNRQKKNPGSPGIGYIPAEIEYRQTKDGKTQKFDADYADMPYLCNHDEQKTKNYLSYLIAARNGDKKAKKKISSLREKYLTEKEDAFKDLDLIENQYVIHSGTEEVHNHYHISHKGSKLLRLVKDGYPVPDFTILTNDWFSLPESGKDKYLKMAISNLEQLTAEKINDPEKPLVFAIRCAMPQYIPGLMPTYLNAGVVTETVEALKQKFGINVAGKIYLNNLLTLYSLLYHDKNIPLLKEQQYCATTGEVYKKIQTYYDLVFQKDKRLLTDAYYQISFLLQNASDFFDNNKDLPYTLIKKKTFPSFILQKMVWTIKDKNSYPGIMYSRHSRTGLGIQIESCKNIFGEDIMSGNIKTTDAEFFNREEIKKSYPAVYHFSPLLGELEKSNKSPVTVEFAAESYEDSHLFAILQLNKSELTGRACLLSAIDLYNKGILGKDSVINLVQPYHLRQIFSDTIDKESLSGLIYFTEGVSVLPRSAISVKVYFSANDALDAKKRGEKVCYCKDHFVPSDAVIMKEVDAIISLNPAAIHVVTACRGYGIPAFLNLESFGIKLDNDTLVNSQNMRIKAGDWITISSKKKTIFLGKAKFTPARFQKYLDGERFELEPKEDAVFKNMAKVYREYEEIVNSLEQSDITDLENLTKLVRNDLRNDQKKAKKYVNSWYDSNSDYYVQQILESDLGTHQDQNRIYDLLSTKRRIDFYKKAIEICRDNHLKGYNAGSFMLGRFTCIKHPTKFWKAFKPAEIIFLLNEYVLFEKYMYVLYHVGERNISRAKSTILEHGLENIIINKGIAGIFMTLKLVCSDWKKIEKKLDKKHELETRELVDMLQKPYGFFYDYNAPWSINQLKSICEEEGVVLPGEGEV